MSINSSAWRAVASTAVGIIITILFGWFAFIRDMPRAADVKSNTQKIFDLDKELTGCKAQYTTEFRTIAETLTEMKADIKEIKREVKSK